MKKAKSLLSLFLSMFKIGLFTFGGGYAMIHLLENEFVSRKEWLDSDEFLDLVAIAESTPGPIAINCATYIGYKKEKITGDEFRSLFDIEVRNRILNPADEEPAEKTAEEAKSAEEAVSDAKETEVSAETTTEPAEAKDAEATEAAAEQPNGEENV